MAGLITSLMTFVSSGAASAAEVPMQLVGSPISTEGVGNYVTAPNGNITVGCRSWSGQDLTTYDQTGAVVQQIDRTQLIDNKPNCVFRPVVDKNGDVYGRQYQNGKVLAYDGNAVKWQYPIQCSTADTSVAVGSDGHIYTLTTESDGTHLIGLAPEVEPGQTQPAKVLDVKVDEGCATAVTAYKDGIILTKFSSNDSERTYSYFSYGGKYLGQPTFPSDIGFYAKTNAEGRLFRQTNDYANMKVLAYNAGSSSPAWTFQFTQYEVTVQAIHPLKGGGVAVRIIDQSGVSKLAVLSATGQFEREIPLDNEYARVAIDEGNKAVAVTIDHSVTPYRAVLRTYDISTGNAIGDAHVLGSTSAGIPDAADAVWVTDDTVYFHAACYWSVPNCDNEAKLYGARVDGASLDYPRGAVLAREKRPATPFRAIGDSFSAGEGDEPFEAGTDIPGLNTCHRSNDAYPKLLVEEHDAPSLGSDGFRACSGAVTSNITDVPQWNEGTQLDLPALPDTTTQLVTLTIGGNDIKFGDFGRACFFGTCEIGSAAYNASLNEINNALPGKLEETYKRILKYTPNAKVYVLGYPQVVADKSATDADDPRCIYMQDGSTKWADAQAARDIVTKLNGKILAKVDAVRALNADYYERLQYIPLDGPDSPFNSHEVCGTSGTSWFKNVDAAINDPSYAFHPNKLGYEGYATVAGAAINAG